MSAVEFVVVGAARTPQGRLMGALSSLSAAELGAAAIRGALERGGVPPASVDAVIAGQVLQAGAGQNPARQAAIGAGINWDVPTVTVNKVCLSGLAAIVDATRMIAVGDADVVVAAGMESMSQAPHLLKDSRLGWKYGAVEMLDHMALDGLTDAFDGDSMGASTERYTAKAGVTREQQDAVAALSHQRAAAAQAAREFADEIVPLNVPQRRGDPVVVSEDEGIRADTTIETLAKLRPAFDADGTITAGSSSQISDGASAVIVTTRNRADAEGWAVLATIVAHGQVAGPDNSLLEQPANAILAALAKANLSIGDMDFVEINEAFASVVVASQRKLAVMEDITNIHGGGIALGHPIGASGARLAVTTVHELVRRGHGTAVIALCGGGGQGDALILSRTQPRHRTGG